MIQHNEDDEGAILRRVAMPPEVEDWVRSMMREMPPGAHLVLQSASERETVCVLVPRPGYDRMDGLADLARHPDRLRALLAYEPQETFSFEQVFESTTR